MKTGWEKRMVDVPYEVHDVAHLNSDSDWVDVRKDRLVATVKERDEWKRGAEEQLRVTRALELERDSLRAEVERLTRLFENAKQLRDVYQTERWELTARAEKAEAREKVLREVQDELVRALRGVQSWWVGLAPVVLVEQVEAALAKARR